MDAATNDILQQILIWLIPCVPAIVLHEIAHGWAAARLGDPTARMMGRLSPNPLRHIDMVGTILLPGLMLLTHMPFVFGWAKPVPVDFRRLRHGWLGVFLVALAGPASNFVMMLGWLAVAKALAGGAPLLLDNIPSLPLQIALSGIVINLVLLLLNLTPIPPLDGGRILGALLPDRLARAYMRVEPFGILIMMLLLVTGAFGMVFHPLLSHSLAMLGIR